MIEPTLALGLVREQLRQEVLPRLDENDDYGRSLVVAAIGVLGELAGRVTEADAWCAPSVERLRASSYGWAERLDGEAAAEVADLVRRSRGVASLADERSLLLEAGERIATAFWAAAERSDAERELHREVRELVAVDNELEVSAGRRR